MKPFYHLWARMTARICHRIDTSTPLRTSSASSPTAENSAAPPPTAPCPRPDLLDDAQTLDRGPLTAGEHWPSRPLDHLVAPGRLTTGTHAGHRRAGPAVGIRLAKESIMVISLLHEDIGPVVDWNIDPHTAFNDHPAAWSSSAPAHRAPRGTPSPNAPAAVSAMAHARRPAPRRWFPPCRRLLCTRCCPHQGAIVLPRTACGSVPWAMVVGAPDLARAGTGRAKSLHLDDRAAARQGQAG